MPEQSLTKTKMQMGTWHGVLTGSEEQPRLTVTHLGKPVDGQTLSPGRESGEWVVQVRIPPAAIADGFQTLLILDSDSGSVLESISILGGEALGDDLRAEVDLLRAELDMLKRAFRRHCVETGA